MVGGADVVGVDISGRHVEDGQYIMVGAAVAGTVGSSRIEEVSGMGMSVSRREPTLENAIGLIQAAVADLPAPPAGPIVAERGEFYEEPARTIGVAFEPEFKYVETIAERKIVDTAHHAAYAARNLIK